MAIKSLKSGIYCIYCIPTGKYYIGQAIDLKQRFRQHKYELNNKKHHSSYLQRAWNKYSAWFFQFHIIEYVEPIKEKLAEREQWWFDLTDCCNRNKGYNCEPSSVSSLGIKRSEETSKKLSLAKIGKPIHTEESKEKIRNARIGKKHSTQSIEKMKIVQNGEKKRKIDKWPCVDGIKCICDNCKEKKRIKHRIWRQSKSIGVVWPSNF